MDTKKLVAILSGIALLLCGLGIILYYCPPQRNVGTSQQPVVYVVTQTDYVYLPAAEQDTTYVYENLQKVSYRTLDGTVHTVSAWNVYYVKDVSVVKPDAATDAVNAYLNAYSDGVYVLMPADVTIENNATIQFGPTGMTSFFCGAVVRREGTIALSAQNRGESVLIEGYEAVNARSAQAFTSKEAVTQAMSYVKIEVPLNDVNVYYK